MQGRRSDSYWECIDLEQTVFFVIDVMEDNCKKLSIIPPPSRFCFFGGPSASSDGTGGA